MDFDINSLIKLRKESHNVFNERLIFARELLKHIMSYAKDWTIDKIYIKKSGYVASLLALLPEYKWSLSGEEDTIDFLDICYADNLNKSEIIIHTKEEHFIYLTIEIDREGLSN